VVGANREGLQQNTAWEVCVGDWHGWRRLLLL